MGQQAQPTLGLLGAAANNDVAIDLILAEVFLPVPWLELRDKAGEFGSAVDDELAETAAEAPAPVPPGVGVGTTNIFGARIEACAGGVHCQKVSREREREIYPTAKKRGTTR